MPLVLSSGDDRKLDVKKIWTDMSFSMLNDEHGYDSDDTPSKLNNINVLIIIMNLLIFHDMY